VDTASGANNNPVTSGNIHINHL